MKDLINNRKEIMSIIWTILIGFVVGLLAKMLTPGRDPSGFFITATIGIVGSLLATFGGQALGLYHAVSRQALLVRSSVRSFFSRSTTS